MAKSMQTGKQQKTAEKVTKMHIKRDDIVVLRTGDEWDKWVLKEEKDKDGNVKSTRKERKTGKVIAVSPKENKVIVQGFNTVSRHKKSRKQGDPGGIIKIEGSIVADKVQLYCDKCDKGVRSKVKLDKDGKKIRVCAKCAKEI